jgi:hypothetical protein
MMPEGKLPIARAKRNAFSFDLRGSGFLLRMHEPALTQEQIEHNGWFRVTQSDGGEFVGNPEEYTGITGEWSEERHFL